MKLKRLKPLHIYIAGENTESMGDSSTVLLELLNRWMETIPAQAYIGYVMTCVIRQSSIFIIRSSESFDSVPGKLRLIFFTKLQDWHEHQRAQIK